MNYLIKIAIVLLIGSIIAMIWGDNYVSSHMLTGIASSVGYSDSTYTMAKLAIPLGVLGFMAGAVVLIVDSGLRLWTFDQNSQGKVFFHGKR
jgi:hypothetical protein